MSQQPAEPNRFDAFLQQLAASPNLPEKSLRRMLSLVQAETLTVARGLQETPEDAKILIATMEQLHVIEAKLEERLNALQPAR